MYLFKTNPLKSLAVVAFIFAVTPAIQAQDSGKQDDKVSPVGNWAWEIGSDSKKRTARLSIKERDGKLVGTLANGKELLKAKYVQFKNGKLTFRVNPVVSGKKTTAEFSGKVTSDSIQGTLSFDDKKLNQKLKARRLNGVEAIAGTWKIEFSTPDGQDFDFQFEVTVKDKKIEVEFLDVDTVDVKKASFKKGTLTIETDQEYQSMDLEVTYLLDIDGNQISGALEYIFVEQDQEGELDVEGQRVK